jgi:hypothetical protein
MLSQKTHYFGWAIWYRNVTFDWIISSKALFAMVGLENVHLEVSERWEIHSLDLRPQQIPQY